MKNIKLTKGKITIVDDDDYERVMNSGYKWLCVIIRGIPYAYGHNNGKHILMHRFIMNAKGGEEVDHINRDSLNNQKMNLRIVDDYEQAANRGIQKRNTSGYKGVWWDKYKNKFRAEFRFRDIRYNGGHFDNAEEAARKYDELAEKYAGEFALTNKELGLID